MTPTNCDECKCEQQARRELAQLRGDLAIWSIDVEATRKQYARRSDELEAILHECDRDGCATEFRRRVAMWIIEGHGQRLHVARQVADLQRILRS